MLDNETSPSYSALDIARLLIRNPDEVVDLPTYQKICDEYCQNRPLEDLPPHLKQSIFSLEAGIHDLSYLGFDERQIETFLEAANEIFHDAKLDMHADKFHIATRAERLQLIGFVLAAFPYGPPLTKNDFNLLALPTYTPTDTSHDLTKATRRLSAKLMEKRESNPYLFTPVIRKTGSIIDGPYFSAL
ncbi:MAG: hypothetical protein ACLFR0_09490 [Alphaproteobacteria bacterium]